jgi:MoaA/NifB/PqqE/SkfB family radical SAM enzyme
MLRGDYLYFLKHNLKSRLLGWREPLLAGLKVTHHCNLHCRACPFWKKDGSGITFHQAQGAMRQLHEEGVRLLVLEGGEPFLWRDGEHTLVDIVAEARRLFFCVGITTNGTLPLESQADILWVSIDGLRENHNYNRGPIFDKMIANIEASSHPKLFANITINRRNWQEVPELVKFLAPKVKGITIQFYYPYEGTEDFFLPFPERRKVLDQLIALKNEGYPVSDSVSALEALKDNSWLCHPWLIASVEPDGTITHGCYLRNRAQISCANCGFAAHAEISLAYNWNWKAIKAGGEIFGFR